MNYRYCVGDKEYILTQEEHERVDGVLEQGGLIRLRGGNIVLNLSFFKSCNETSEMTESQQSNYLKLKGPEVKRSGNGLAYLKSSKKGFYERMGWS